jgi:hypothetical protein
LNHSPQLAQPGAVAIAGPMNHTNTIRPFIIAGENVSRVPPKEIRRFSTRGDIFTPHPTAICGMALKLHAEEKPRFDREVAFV